jgi:hypothetical protein
MLPDVMARSQFGSALITKLDPSKRSAMWICRDHDSFGYLCCDTRMGGETPERVRLTLNLQCGYSIETRGCGTANVIEQLVELSRPAPLAPRTQPDVAHSHGALSLLHIAQLRVRRAPQPSNWRRTGRRTQASLHRYTYFAPSPYGVRLCRRARE